MRSRLRQKICCVAYLAQSFSSFPPRPCPFWTNTYPFWTFADNQALTVLKKLIPLLVACFFITSPNCVWGQNVDSLRALLETDLAVIDRIHVQNDLALAIHYYAPDECLQLAREASDLAAELELIEEQATGLHRQVLAQHVNGNLAESINSGEYALELLASTTHYQLRYDIRNALHFSRAEVQDFVGAIKEIEEMIKLAKLKGDQPLETLAKEYLAELHLETGNPELALSILEETIAERIALNDTISLATSYGSLSRIYGSSQQSKEYLQKAVRLAEAGTNLFSKISLNWSYGNLLLEEGAVEESLTAYRRSFELASAINEPYFVTRSSYGLAQAFTELGVIDSAIFYYDLIFSIPITFNSTKDRRFALESRSELALQLGNIDSAHHYLRLALSAADSLHNQQQQELITDAQTRYDLAAKDAELTASQLEIVRQRNVRQRVIGVGILLLLVTGLGFAFFIQRQQRRKREAERALAAEQHEAERLREIDELKTQFFTNVSHELRTPLTLITSPLEESLKELKQVGLGTKLQLAYKNSKRLLSLTNEILDLAKLEAGHLQLEASNFLILPRVSRLLAAFQSQAETKHIELQLNPEIDQDLQLTTAPKALDTILNNLIANAVKFTPNGGRVQLDIRQQGDQLRLSIKDGGPGIHPEDLPHLFDRFYQSRHRQSPEGGTGIGLALSKQLADRINASLTVDNEDEQGSCFTLLLPLKAQLTNLTALTNTLEKAGINSKAYLKTSIEAAPTSTNKTDDALAPLVNPEAKILIVEDHPDMSSYLMNSLQKHYQCFQAYNGKEALQILQQQRVDLILSDVMMPEMDGFEFRSAVNELEQFSRIPFILLTARSLEADKLRGFQLGIDDYITKPFSLPELEARIANLLRNKLNREEEWGNETPSSQGEQILRDIYDYVQHRLDDTSWGVVDMAKDLGYSQRHLARLIGPITGLSLVQLILEIRLQKAFKLLQENAYPTVTEVRYAIGIESASYFSRKYKERFGVSPGMVMEN